MKILFLSATLLCGGALIALPAPVQAQAQDITTTSTSEVADVQLPSQTMRFAPKAVPQEIIDSLQSMVSASGFKRGRTEVLAWAGGGYKKSRAGEYKARVAAALEKGGWQYEEGASLESTKTTTRVSATRTSPTRKAIMGFWAPTDEGLILAWAEILPAKSSGIVPPDFFDASPTAKPTAAKPIARPVALPAAAPGVVFNITDDQFVVNVAKGLPAPKVSFNKIAPKPGKVRGYVKGSDGRPLKGAVIGVASTAVGGAETSASAKTDANGYYELTVPFGVARFYAAGYNKEYGDGILALGLTPADGDSDEFASQSGHVENWYLQTYGIADRAGVQDDPKYLNNYFGGSVTLEFLNENSGIAGPKGLPFGSTVEVTLTPKGSLMDGSKGRTITIRKVIKDGAAHRLYVNNIPIGLYRLSARMLRNGESTPLNLSETGPYSGMAFGLEPKNAQGAVDLAFRPYTARAESVTAGHGNWKEVDVNIMQ